MLILVVRQNAINSVLVNKEVPAGSLFFLYVQFWDKANSHKL